MAKAHIDLIFRAFSDRTRLRILCLLTHDEMCVGDLVKVLQVPQPTASRHLSYLRRAGLVETRKNGLWVHYRLAPARTAFHRNILKCLGNCFHDVPEIADDAKRAGSSENLAVVVRCSVFFDLYIRLCECIGRSLTARSHGNLWQRSA